MPSKARVDSSSPEVYKNGASMRAFFVLLCVSLTWLVVTPAEAAALLGPRIELVPRDTDEVLENEATLETSVDVSRVRLICDDLARLDSEPRLAEDEGCEVEVEVAAYCDERGATMLAPPRVRPIAEGKIEASPLCLKDLFAGTGAPAARYQDDGSKKPHAQLFQPIDPAALTVEVTVPSGSYELEPWRRSTYRATGKDHPHRLDRPPTP